MNDDKKTFELRSLPRRPRDDRKAGLIPLSDAALALIDGAGVYGTYSYAHGACFVDHNN